ncbi:MAG: DUF362 domain-containing protein [Candidatus Tectomicrobia bacterium]|uniref:DUF362 domain-containing protein n=1 Tax=Tectimicrobiota bacterium TaxID=2528274 RepID=A0A933GLJ6_UNCTE|nr:DUF362 domain-containing protein [Candidatus Tectomicrobia bacterium]
MQLDYSRRIFLKKLTALGLGAIFSRLLLPVGAQGNTRPNLVVARGEVGQAVKAAIEALGGLSSFVKSGQKVVLKPNMSFANTPDWATTTHPAVVATVAKLCLEAGAKSVLVIDNTLRQTDLCLEKSGIKQALRPFDKTHIFGINSRKFFKERQIPQGKELKTVDIAKDLVEADVFINLPVAKSHSQAGVSLGLKNLMGLIWDRNFLHSYINLDQGIADLASIIRPNLTILDASRALLTAGPGGPGKVEILNTVVAGVDPVAVDSYSVTLAKWYGQSFRGHNVKHINAAYKMGLGEIDLARMNIREIRV